MAYKVFDVAALNMMRGMNWLGDIEELESFVFNLMQTSLLEKITEPIFVDYIESMDNSMLETAAILTKKWGVLKWYPWDCEDFY